MGKYPFMEKSKVYSRKLKKPSVVSKTEEGNETREKSRWYYEIKELIQGFIVYDNNSDCSTMLVLLLYFLVLIPPLT